MKKAFLILIVSLLSLNVRAAWVDNFPITLTQPDGSVIHCFVSGDEFFNWAHDAEGYPIIQNSSNGFYCYAVRSGESMIASSYIVGTVNPASAGIEKGVVFPKDNILQKRTALEKTKIKPGAKNFGVINNLVIFITFSDQTEFPTPFAFYNSKFNSASPDSNSMFNYFKTVSYNQLDIPSTFYPLPSGGLVVSYQDPNPRSYYMPYDATTNPGGYTDQGTTEQQMLADAINAVKSQIPGSIDLDFNNDGFVDNICFIVRGAPTAWATLLWPHRWSLYTQTVTIGSLEVSDYNLQIEDFFFLPDRGVGVLNHEMFHTLSAPDLYHYDMAYRNFRSLGPWDLMDKSKNPSQSMGAWMKNKYGLWINTIPQITAPGIYTIKSIMHPDNNAYQLSVPNSVDEFFVFEYRRNTGVFESSIPGSGLLITRININSWGNADFPMYPDEIYAYRPGGIDTINGLYANAAFSVASGRTTFNNSSDPYDFFSDNTTLGDIDIQVLSETDSTVTFSFNWYTGIEETDASGIIMYPNPVSQSFNIDWTAYAGQIDQISITDALGRLICKSECLEMNKYSFDFSQHAKGLYIVNLKGKTVNIKKKIIVN